MFYPEEIVQEVRSRADIVDVIGQYVNLKKKGANYFGLCPFHGEKTASFSVNPRMQIFHCFGCGKGGDVIKFTMEYENLTFPEAVRKIAEETGYKLPEMAQTAEQKKESDIRTRLLEINRTAAVYFFNALRAPQGQTGMNYFKKRELMDETLRIWGLGYADQTRDGLYQYLKSSGFDDDILHESGLITFSEKGVYDKFFNRVMFPIMDANNRVIGFGGRVLGDGEPKYLNSPETKLFDKSRNLFGLCYAKKSRKKSFILCEGYMDVIQLHQAGFTNAVASLGTALTEQQCRLIKRYVNEVLLTYDSDGAGINAAKRAMPMLKAVGINTKVINMKPYKDPDEFIKAMGLEAFQEHIDNARNSFLWLIDVMKMDYDLSDPAGMTQYTNDVAEKLSEITEPIERENYIKAVAREQMIDYDSLRKLVNHMGDLRERKQSPLNEKIYKHTDFISKADKKTKKETALQKSEKQLVTWLQEKPELIPSVRNYILPEDLSDETMQKVISMVYQQTPANEILDTFRDSDDEYEKVAAMFNGNLLSDDSDEYEFKRGLEDIIRNIKMTSLNTKIENETDPHRLTDLFKQQSDLMNLKL
ncbi:DNA primase [Oribacterium sp. WCC10]|uniref:DNA primase n=1 Tax=Oribacterium sp. WCC10 TaxID=1855343 RepID=UPI0008EA400E|nr:DNA primase [Oribacterium sp. WCC10]SFG41567.1 DNA primase [Oribacterium sp. WCC10]